VLPHLLKNSFKSMSASRMNIDLQGMFGNELQVFLQPNKIELNLLRADGFRLDGFKAKTIHKKIIEVENETQLFAQLSSALQNPIWRKAKPVAVFSSAFTHFSVLPWNVEIKSKQERSAYLQHRFLQHFGDASKDWRLCEHVDGYGKAAIASGIDANFFEQVEAVFAAANMPLKAAHPLLMLAMNQAIFYLKKNKLAQIFWLACEENQRLTLVLIIDGEWKLVRNVPLETNIHGQLRTLIQREMVLENMEQNLFLLSYKDGEIQLATKPQQEFIQVKRAA
jgi:hypothetical protein